MIASTNDQEHNHDLFDDYDVKEYEKIAASIQENEGTSTVKQMGYAPVNYSWNNNHSKVEKLIRAVVPSSNNARRIQSLESPPRVTNDFSYLKVSTMPNLKQMTENVSGDSMAKPKNLTRSKSANQLRKLEPNNSRRLSNITAQPKEKELKLKLKPSVDNINTGQLKQNNKLVDGTKYEYNVHGRLVPSHLVEKAAADIALRRRIKSVGSIQCEEIFRVKSDRVFNPNCALIKRTQTWTKEAQKQLTVIPISTPTT